MAKSKRKKDEKYEDIEVLGPEELENMTIEDIENYFVLKEKKSAKVKKKKPEKFEHYYTVEPTSELKVKELKLKLKNGHEYVFKAPSGVYAKKRIDKATRVLIEYAQITGKKLLDLGCGYGVIGITLKKENPDIEIYMSDINKRAVEFAKINAKDNNIYADIRWGDMYEPWENEKFDMIISNPPIVAGKKVWMKLIEEAPKHLNENGTLQLVAYHNKGGRRIRDYMKKIFGNVLELVKYGGIRVYMSKKVNK